jgi:hypothetical protein
LQFQATASTTSAGPRDRQIDQSQRFRLDCVADRFYLSEAQHCHRDERGQQPSMK